MGSNLVDCSITVSPQCQLGSYVNAFRILEGEEKGSVFLDFLLYSSVEGKAVLVSRICVQESTLPVIEALFEEVLINFSGCSCDLRVEVAQTQFN